MEVLSLLILPIYVKLYWDGDFFEYPTTRGWQVYRGGRRHPLLPPGGTQVHRPGDQCASWLHDRLAAPLCAAAHPGRGHVSRARDGI